jgi:cytochrome c peroxidase
MTGLLLAACLASFARSAMGPQSAEPKTESSNKHRYLLPEVLVEGSRRFAGYSSFFSWTLAVSPDGRFAATGDKDKNLVLWDLAAGKPAKILKGHGDTVFNAAFLPDGRGAVSVSLDGTLRFWELESGKQTRSVAAGAPLLSVAVSPDGALVLTGAQNGAVKLWRARDGALARELSKGSGAAVVAARFALGGKKAITSELGGKATIWDAASGKAERTLDRQGRVARGAFVSPDGKTFLLGGRVLSLVDVETGKTLREFEPALAQRDAVLSVAFAPDGKTFAAEDEEYSAGIVETATGKRVRGFTLGDHALGLAFMPDGRRLVAMIGSDFNIGAVFVWSVDAKPDLSKGRLVPYPPDPEARPASAASAELGKLLFFDKRLSRDATISCASCHDPKKGWADGRPVAVGIRGQTGRRNSMTLLNAAGHDPLFWDGRSANLEQQVGVPVADPKEMDFSLKEAAERLAGVAGYRKLFQAAFGDARVDAGRIASAIAAFERTLVSRDSPYDRFDKGEEGALGEQARRGFSLFQGKARCFECHRLNANGGAFFNLGLSTSSSDLGRFEVTKDPRDRRAFGPPDLHNLRFTAPYMHDGSIKTLPEVVDFYDRGGGAVTEKAVELAPLGLSPAEKADLLSFLDALNGDPLAFEAPRPPR